VGAGVVPALEPGGPHKINDERSKGKLEQSAQRIYRSSAVKIRRQAGRNPEESTVGDDATGA